MKLIESGWTNRSIADDIRRTFDLETTDDSIRRFRRRHGVQVPGQVRAGVKLMGDVAEATTHVKQRTRSIHDDLHVPGQKPMVTSKEGISVLDNPDQMLSDRGLDPADWYIDAVTVNEWDGPQKDGTVVTYYQAKFTAKRKRPEYTLQPVRSDGWTPPKRTVRRTSERPELVVICGDFHAPFHDVRLNELFCEWLEVNRPDRGVNLGDLVDFPDISRHDPDPENMSSAQECLQAGYDLLRSHVDASPDTDWRIIFGNHDQQRLRSHLIKHSPQTYGLRQVDTPTEDGVMVNHLNHLMRLDELGIQYVDSHGSYENAQLNISDRLAVRHGHVVKKGSGASALGTLEQMGYSVLIGHVHRQALVHKTCHEIDGTPRVLVGAEIGCMCRIDNSFAQYGRRFPNYTVLPDWTNGFATATIYPDNFFKIDLATYVNGTLLYQGQRYQ